MLSCPIPLPHHRSLASSPTGARRPSWEAEAFVGELTLLHTTSQAKSSGQQWRSSTSQQCGRVCVPGLCWTWPQAAQQERHQPAQQLVHSSSTAEAPACAQHRDSIAAGGGSLGAQGCDAGNGLLLGPSLAHNAGLQGRGDTHAGVSRADEHTGMQRADEAKLLGRTTTMAMATAPASSSLRS